MCSNEFDFQIDGVIPLMEKSVAWSALVTIATIIMKRPQLLLNGALEMGASLG